MSSSSSWRGQGRGGRGEGRGGRGPRGRFHSHHQYGQRQPNWQYSLHRAGNPVSHHRSWERDRDSHNDAERSRQDQYYPSSQRTQDTTSKKGTGANYDYMSKPIPAKRNRNRDPVMNSSTGTVRGPGANDTAGVPRAAEAAVLPPPPSNAAVLPTPPSNAESNDPSSDANAATEDVTMTDATEPETTKRPKLERDLIVTRENWEKVSMAQKLLSESPFETVDLNLADEIRVPKLWLDKKFKAVEDTVEEMKALIERDNDRYYDPYDSERSEESVIVGNNYGSCDRTPPGFYKFVRTLPYSILFDAGFLVVGVHADDEKNCLCPCSLRMKKWRHNMGLCEPTGLDNCGVSFKKGSPNALMDHIKKMASHENAYLHKALKLYLENLYDKFWNELSPGVHHKGLYIAGTNDFKRAEAAEKKYLQRAINHYEAELKRKDDLIKQKEKELRELEELRESNKTLAEKVTLLEKNRATLGVTEQAKFIKIDDIDEKSLHSMKNQIACLMDMQGASIMTEEVYEPVRITTPPKISIQELFDKWFKEGTKDKTYLFRSLDNLSAKYKEGQFAYKVLCDWNVNIEVPKEVMTKGVRGVNGITAVDQGGPTRSFITAFCEQLRDLCVYIPLNKYEELKEPPAFSKIQTRLGGMKGTVVREGKGTKGKQTSFRIKFEDGQEELLERAQFKVLEYPFPLFESGDGISCAIPQKDTTFENMFYNVIKEIDSEYDLQFLLQKVCRYYEAIGRFIVHTMFDEKVILSSVVMPQLLKKYFFRGISPDDGEFRYPLAELLVDIQNMEPTFTIENATGSESTFGLWQIDDEFIQKHNFHGTVKASDPITDKNFRTLAVLYILKTRDMALQHIQKGLTLGGRLEFHHIFFAVPTVVLNALYFSNPSYDINDIIKILIFNPYKNKNLEASHLSILKENHKLFQETTLPTALRILQSKDKDTLQKFIYFVTGCSYLPNFEMNPHFRIDVEFQKKKDPGALPTSHTCEKIVVFPVEVYDNNAETLASKLEKAFSFGDCFGMQ